MVGVTAWEAPLPALQPAGVCRVIRGVARFERVVGPARSAPLGAAQPVADSTGHALDSGTGVAHDELAFTFDFRVQDGAPASPSHDVMLLAIRGGSTPA